MRRGRKLWIILLAAPLMLLGADTVYWWLAMRHLEEGFAAWEAEQAAAGWIESHGPAAHGGWPLAATLTVPAMSLSATSPDVPGGLAWTADRLVLRVALTRPGVLEILADGNQRLRFGASTQLAFTAGRFRLMLPLEVNRWPDFGDLATDKLTAGTPAGEASVQSLRLHMDFDARAQSGEPAMRFSLQAEGVSPPAGIVRPLGPSIAQVEVDGALTGPVPPARALADQAAAWRDGGGSLEIRRLTMAWGPLDLTATATLALDDQLQPMGAGSAHIVGYAETLDALAAHAAISRSAAVAAKAVLSLLAHNPEDGGRPDVDVPLTLQYRTLSMRQVPLVRLPELDWP